MIAGPPPALLEPIYYPGACVRVGYADSLQSVLQGYPAGAAVSENHLRHRAAPKTGLRHLSCTSSPIWLGFQVSDLTAMC